jgi:uncharacterized protein (TIGR03000 family)
MTPHRWLPRTLFLLVVSAGLLLPGVAAAESPFAWRIIIGAPPDPYYRESAENGMLYPPGFSPGYGYARDYMKMPSIVLTNQVPRVIPAEPVLYTPQGIEAQVLQLVGVVQVLVPADAELWFSGEKTSQRGPTRLFVTPALAPGKTFTYEIRAHWQENGREVVRSRKLVVNSGARLTVDLRKAEADETILPPPRKVAPLE